MADKTNFQTAVYLLTSLGLPLVILLATVSLAQAQGNVVEIPAPKTEGKFNLQETSPPIHVKLKDWHCHRFSMESYLSYELNRFIERHESILKSTLKAQRDEAKNVFNNMVGSFSPIFPSAGKSPEIGPFNPPPGNTIIKWVKHCYTKEEQTKWKAFLTKIANHLANHPDPLKETKRLAQNFK